MLCGGRSGRPSIGEGSVSQGDDSSGKMPGSVVEKEGSRGRGEGGEAEEMASVEGWTQRWVMTVAVGCWWMTSCEQHGQGLQISGHTDGDGCGHHLRDAVWKMPSP